MHRTQLLHKADQHRSPGLEWRALIPVAALLLAQVVLYLWMVPRGFEFTDESYYVLNYLYWRDLVGTVTFFGAFFEIPFRALGESVPAIRVLSLLMLLGSGAFFTRAALRFDACCAGIESGGAPFVAVGMATTLMYFGYFSTLRAPSYNLLALCCMLVATGLLLQVLHPRTSSTHASAAMFFYGMVVAACGLSKATSGALLVLFHAFFFLVANGDWRLRRLLELLTLALVGVGLIFAALQWVHPQWLAVLREGIAMSRIIDDRYGFLNLVNMLRWDIQSLVPWLLPWTFGAVVTFLLISRLVKPWHRTAVSVLASVVIVGCVGGLMWKGLPHLWLVLISLAVLFLWMMEPRDHRFGQPIRGESTEVGLMIMLLTLPLVFSFGTNGRVLEHSLAAGVFAMVAVMLRLHRLFQLGLLATPVLAFCLTALCLPTLAFQWRTIWDSGFTYRLLAALGEQLLPIRVGSRENILMVDAATRGNLQLVIEAAHGAGLAPGQPIQDFTGDGSGLIYALGGRPLGTAWMAGGYLGSEKAAARLIEQLSPLALKSAWLLTSDSNQRTIKGWQQLLNARLGSGTHQQVASISIRAPYRWSTNAPETIDVQLWKPIDPAL